MSHSKFRSGCTLLGARKEEEGGRSEGSQGHARSLSGNKCTPTLTDLTEPLFLFPCPFLTLPLGKPCKNSGGFLLSARALEVVVGCQQHRRTCAYGASWWVAVSTVEQLALVVGCRLIEQFALVVGRRRHVWQLALMVGRRERSSIFQARSWWSTKQLGTDPWLLKQCSQKTTHPIQADLRSTPSHFTEHFHQKAPPPTPTTFAKPSSKKKQSLRSPLQDLNRISSSSNSSDASSCVSTEAPKVPHEPALKQSKSKSSKENLPKVDAGFQKKTLVSDKARTNRKNPPCLYQWQSGKRSGSRTGQKSKPLDENGKFLPTLPSTSKELKQKEDILGGGNDDNAGETAHLKLGQNDPNLTPLSKKVVGSDLNITVCGDVEENPNTSISRTPPIHNSVSPEIQCGSSLVSTSTPACYGAGYVVSGVTDKRKCRPRGILTVEENCSGFGKMAVNSFDEDEKKITDVMNETSPSLLPLPTEALVHWISSPRNKGKKILNRKSENELNQSQGLAESTIFGSSTSPSSSSKTFWNVSDSSDFSGVAYGIRRKMSSSISPSGLSEFKCLSDEEDLTNDCGSNRLSGTQVDGGAESISTDGGGLVVFKG
ncbi:hypothetical protein SESBI_12784 [Sesbania bispinosa]|nr:hypothetical protein SESBI_12784 [Sesbania bispinosa]